MEQMELFECLNIKLSGLTEIPKDVEIKKVEVKEVKRATRSSGAVVKNVAKPPEKEKVTPPVKVPAPPGIEAEERVNYMCDLCDSKVTSIEKHLESEHEEIMPIPIAEIATFFTIIPPTKVVQKKPAPPIEENSTTKIEDEPKNLKKRESSPSTKSPNVGGFGRGRPVYDGPDGVKCPSCPRMFAMSAAKLKDNLRCHIGMIHYGQQLLDEVEKFYKADKCKECGHAGKHNAQKKKHMLFHHTEYVAEVLSVVDKAIKSGKEGRMKDEKSEDAKVADDGDLNVSKRKREEDNSGEESKSLKLDPQLKVVNLKELTMTAHAEVEDLLMSDDEDDLEDAQDKDAGREQESLKEDANLEEAMDDNNVRDGQSSEVLSIQDQLLQMQDLSSEEDEDEDADDRLKEFVGEGLSEEESEDLEDEKKVEATNIDGDYDIDVGNLIPDEDFADDIADDESSAKDQNEEDFVENDYVGMKEPADNETHDDNLGNISDDEEEVSEDNLEDVLNFENGEEDDEGDSETAPNSDQEDDDEQFASAMSTEMLEKLNNLLSS